MLWYAGAALAAGGIFGTGLGNSKAKWSGLPEAHNDFIFAIIGEELGFLGCLVVVTSRNRMPGLVAREGAWPVHVGRLTAQSARNLLTLRLGPARLADEPAVADRLVQLCAGLPLALSIAAARIAVTTVRGSSAMMSPGCTPKANVSSLVDTFSSSKTSMFSSTVSTFLSATWAEGSLLRTTPV